ncbi:hypothetical protein ACOSP7_031097 [Xanthoceras sorbifolium]
MLHNKYLKNKNIVEVCGKNSSRCSSTWRGIAHGINLLLEGGIWRIGDGSSVAFWTDRWIQGMDTLRDHAVCPLDQDKISEKVSCYIENDCWSMVNTTDEVEDCMIWGNDSEGSFTIKSAYNSFFDKGLGDQWKFDIVWKIRVPPKIQCFLCWVKLNVNGSRNSLGCIAGGGVIRDSNGQWIGGFISNKGIGNVLEAELWGMAEGLFYAWQAGFKLVIIETDCKHIVELLGQEIKRCHPLFNLLHKCKSFIQGDWICKVTHVYMEVNMLADWMAKLGLQQPLGLKYFEDPPTGCKQILDEDAAGWPAASAVFSVF